MCLWLLANEDQINCVFNVHMVPIEELPCTRACIVSCLCGLCDSDVTSLDNGKLDFQMKCTICDWTKAGKRVFSVIKFFFLTLLCSWAYTLLSDIIADAYNCSWFETSVQKVVLHCVFYSRSHINLRLGGGIKTPATVFMMRRIYSPLPVMRHKFPVKLWLEPS